VKADRAKTLARNFINPKSYVAADGREVLADEDWLARKKELWDRSGGRCEAWFEIIGLAPERCIAEAADPHHIVRRSVRRDDRLSNLLALCRDHHLLLDERRIRSDRAERRASNA